MSLYARTNWSLYRARPQSFLTYAPTVTASGAGATATTSAPSGSAAQVNCKITGFRLVSKAGAAQASVTGITALVHLAVPSSKTPPDKFVSGASTDGSGNLSDIDISDLQSTTSPVWLTLYKDGSPAKATTIKVTPTVS